MVPNAKALQPANPEHTVKNTKLSQHFAPTPILWCAFFSWKEKTVSCILMLAVTISAVIIYPWTKQSEQVGSQQDNPYGIVSILPTSFMRGSFFLVMDLCVYIFLGLHYTLFVVI